MNLKSMKIGALLSLSFTYQDYEKLSKYGPCCVDGKVEKAC